MRSASRIVTHLLLDQTCILPVNDSLARLDSISSEWDFHGLENLFNNVVDSHTVQDSLHGFDGTSPLHTPLILWLGDDNPVPIYLAGCEGNDGGGGVVQAVEQGKGTMLVSLFPQQATTEHTVLMLSSVLWPLRIHLLQPLDAVS